MGACVRSRSAPGAEPITPKADPTALTRELPAVDEWRIEYALRSAELVQQRWLQFPHADPCILLVGPEAQWALNCESAPEEFATGRERFRDRPVFVRVGGQFMTNGHSLDTADFIRAVPATIALPRPGQSRNSLAQDRPFILVSALDALKRLHPTFSADTTTERWLSIFIHEFFHVLQYSDRALGHPSEVDGSPLVQLYETDAEYRRMLHVEYAVLADEVVRRDSDDARTRAALRTWDDHYQVRRSYLSALPKGPQLVRLDALLCYVEGLARYVEGMYLVDARYHLQADGANDPSFKHFSEYEGCGYAGMPNRQLSAEYYYALGMHIALLLDRLTPDWSQRVHAAPEWVVGTASASAREPPSR